MIKVRFYSLLLKKVVVRECYTFAEAVEIAKRNNGIIVA